jgi:hypothetical protein
VASGGPRNVPQALSRKRLEPIRGYLVHVAQTYSMFSRYLIGLHMTINFWRPNWDQDGWRRSAAYIQGIKDQGDWPLNYDSGQGSSTVRVVPRLTHDIRALEELTFGEIPLLRQVGGKKTGRVLCGFGDASKVAFGTTIQIEDRLLYQYCQWSSKIVESETSNWWFFICVTWLSQSIWAGIRSSCSPATLLPRRLFGRAPWYPLDCLIWSCNENGWNSNILHLIHISGKRMIVQGTDGLSQADHSQEVRQGKPIQDFVLLHLNLFDQEPGVKVWLQRITAGLNHFALCNSAWCGGCFVPLGPKVFLVRTLVDEEGELLDHHVERDQFNAGRAEDHLITPFQCEFMSFSKYLQSQPLFPLSYRSRGT